MMPCSNISLSFSLTKGNLAVGNAVGMDSSACVVMQFDVVYTWKSPNSLEAFGELINHQLVYANGWLLQWSHQQHGWLGLCLACELNGIVHLDNFELHAAGSSSGVSNIPLDVGTVFDASVASRATQFGCHRQQDGILGCNYRW